MEHMHQADLCHRDLKLENIMVDSQLRLKLVDFGFASFGTHVRTTDYRGTHSYMAPEIIDNVAYCGGQADIFSFAVVLFTLVVGHFPFMQASRTDKFYSLIREDRKEEYFIKARAEHLSPEFKDLFYALANPNPSKRLTLSQIEAHPWFIHARQEESRAKRELI